MTSLIIASAKGSPGVTTAALALAASWPLDSGRAAPLVAELDPAGGDIGAWFDLPPQPGLVSLAAAARRGLAPSTVLAHTQALPGGLRVLIGPPSPMDADAALRMLQPGEFVARLDQPAGVDLVIDAGRLDPGTPLLPAMASAGATLMFVRPLVSDVLHVAPRVEELRATARRAGIVVVGPGPYTADQVADALQLELVGTLPFDREGAAMLGGRGGSRRALARSPLMRAARTLVLALVGRAWEGTLSSDRAPRSRVGQVPAAEIPS